MSDMVERVARAMAERRFGKGCPVEEEDFAAARAAIEAMREPTKQMVASGTDAVEERRDWSRDTNGDYDCTDYTALLHRLYRSGGSGLASHD